MPSARKMTTPVAIDLPVVEARYAELDDFTLGYESFKADIDTAPLFVGLPDDRCQCPHWGIVTAGQITFRWADHAETYGEGDAYFAPPGHTTLISEGTSVTEFSPSGPFAESAAAIERNLANGAMS